MINYCTNTQFIGKKLIYLPTCPSTNSHTANLASKGEILEGTVVYTHSQSAGRGQRGNAWESEPHKNLTFSVLLQPTFLSISEQFDLNIMISLAIRDFIHNLVSHPPKVKWPNDIYFNDKKITGILIENYLKGKHIQHAIVGIGLNVNQEHFKHPKATSVHQITGKYYPLEKLMESLLEHIEKRYLELRAKKINSLKQEYLQSLYWYQEEHLFASVNKEGEEMPFSGEIIGISPEGRLAINTQNGVQYFGLKEVKFLR